MKKAVITGATGFIGSWLAEELLDNNVAVAAVARDSQRLTATLRSDPRCTVIEKDLMCLERSDFAHTEYDAFFHLAWSGVSSEDKNNVTKQIANIEMSLKCLEICSAIQCRRFIAAGTVAEYALSDNVISSSMPPSPNDIYGATKAAVHNYLDVRSRQLGQQFNWVIIPSTYGERRDDNNIVTYTIRSLLKGERPIYGDLEQMWDFLYVGEVVRAIRLIGERGIPGKTYGIGSGEYKPLKEYITEIKNLIDPGLDLGIGDIQDMSRRAFSSCVNIYDLRKDTEFVPRIDFEEGIRRTIKYWKDQKKL